VKDLAEAAVNCLTHPAAARRTYYVASPEIQNPSGMADEIAAQMRTWTVALPLPMIALWPVCLFQEILSRLTRKPNVLSLQKYAELCAAGWVCDPGRLRQELDFVCTTGLRSGIAETLAWYRRQDWL
jgi:nucleoside-diphosphate-sugar epimerase